MTALPEYPFWVIGQGWTAAGELRRGSALLTHDGLVVHVDSVERRVGAFTVYNFEVANLHTYYVSSLGLLVHNSCGKRPSKFRKGTIEDAWNNAPDGPNGGKLCPTCGGEVNTRPGQGPRDWDIDHQPPWSLRDHEGMTRQQVLDDFNSGTRLECPGCNRPRGARPAN